MFRWCDGIGRHEGLKIPWWRDRAGSSPATSTKKIDKSFGRFVDFSQ